MGRQVWTEQPLVTRYHGKCLCASLCGDFCEKSEGEGEMNAAYASLRRKARGRRGPARPPDLTTHGQLPRRGEGRPQRRRQIRQKPWAGGLSAPVRRPRETRKGGASRFPGNLKPKSKTLGRRGPLTRSAFPSGRRAAKPWQRLRGLRRPLGRHKKRPQSKPCSRVADSRGESGSFILLRTKSFAHPYPPLP